MEQTRILGILVETKSEAALRVQDVLTKYGCSVRTRLGIHLPDKPGCKKCGLILLELFGNEDECLRLENELYALEGVSVEKMDF